MTQSPSTRSSSGRVPRPMNKFLCFSASERGREARQGIRDPKQCGKATGLAWKALRPEEKRVYEEMAEAKKREHRMIYPDYKHKPKKKNKAKSPRTRQEAPQTAASGEPSSVFPGLSTIDVDDPLINPISPPFPTSFSIDFPANFPMDEGFDDPFSM